MAFCASVGMYGNPRLDYFSWALNWGLAYDLPNHTWIVNELNKKHFPKPFVQRRHRRELYNRMELAIDKYESIRIINPWASDLESNHLKLLTGWATMDEGVSCVHYVKVHNTFIIPAWICLRNCYGRSSCELLNICICNLQFGFEGLLESNAIGWFGSISSRCF